MSYEDAMRIHNEKWFEGPFIAVQDSTFKFSSTPCDVCGYDMASGGASLSVGMVIQVYGSIETERFKAMFGKESLLICCCCMAKAMGVKPLGGIS